MKNLQKKLLLFSLSGFLVIIIILSSVNAVHRAGSYEETELHVKAKLSEEIKSNEEIKSYIVRSPVLDVLRRPEQGAEKVTQLLYNDRLIVLKTESGWANIQVVDQSRSGRNYPGWVQLEQIVPVPGFSYDNNAWVVISQPSAEFYTDFRENKMRNQSKQIYFGTILKYLGYVKEKHHKQNGKTVTWLHCEDFAGTKGWVMHSQAQIRQNSPFIPDRNALNIVNNASLFNKTCYLWGGMTREGIDCSGLTYMIYRFSGYIIPRDADDQFRTGTPVDLSSLKPGDLVFYGEKGRITHVGVYAANGMIWHSKSSRGVVYESVLAGNLRNKYMGARRILPEI
jgi:gamma-D-glutamyl-L-lysine dipeptidyl-peptidase